MDRIARVAAMAVVVVVVASCAPSVGSTDDVVVGPVADHQNVSIALDGAYSYEGGGPVQDGDLSFTRVGDRLARVDGTVEVPGKGASPAEVAFNVAIDPLGSATGSITIVDPAAGLRVDVPMLFSPVELSAGAVTGRATAPRVWRVLEFRDYSLAWAIEDAGPPTADPPPPLPVVSSGELSAVTYNVAGLPEPFSGSQPTVFNPQIGSRLDAYDMALLQEDFFYPDLVAHGHSFAWGTTPDTTPWGGDPTRPNAIVGSGLERYSKLPFAEHRRVRWPGCFGVLPFDGGASDCLSQKGFSVARHTLAQGVEVDVYNLHAEAGSTPEDKLWSARQYEELAEFISANSAGSAVLLGGDTNLHVDDPVDAAVWQTFLDATGLQDACELLACADQPLTIDRWAVRSSADLVLEPLAWTVPTAEFTSGGTRLSDHDPTVLDLRWRAG